MLQHAGAAEPNGLQMAAAIEDAMVQAIARAERSVVSIARVSGAQAAEMITRVDVFGPPFADRRPPSEPDSPADPSFVPNEFATGVVVGREGLILTNFHVLREGSQYWIRTIEHKTYRAEVRAADERSDLAVLSVTGKVEGTEFTPIEFGDAAALKKGQIVIALGNPYAIARDGQASASWGIISNLSRKLGAAPTSEGASLHQLGTLIQTDAKLNLGTSGGALLNLQGQMIGLTTALAATSGFEQAAGYAIPVDAAFLRILDTLKAGRRVEYGFLGVAPQNLAGHEIREGRQGVRIAMVSIGTPAKKYEVRDQDVVTHINGVAIHDADGLRLEIGKLPPNEIVTLSIDRGGQTLTRQVVLSKLPPRYDSGRRVVTQPDPDWRGLHVDYIHAVLPDAMWPALADSGVAVKSVESSSPAAALGLRETDVITHVGGTPVATPEEFHREVAGRRGAITLVIVAAEDGRRRTIELPAP